jgi:hypothetical protein
VILYHGWEPYQFKRHGSHQTILPSPLNPIHFAGGYFHLQPFMITGEPGQNDRGTRLEVEPVAASPSRPTRPYVPASVDGPRLHG